MSDKQAFALAAKHPEYIVLLSRPCSDGDFWWHVRADGTKCCETNDDGRVTKRLIENVSDRYKARATHVVVAGCGPTRKIAL